MEREERLKDVSIPEDSTAHKVAIKYVFNPHTNEFYPDGGGLYSTEPQLHRKNVTSVDVDDPGVESGIDCKGFVRCRFDVDVVGDGITSLKVGILRWNSKANEWFDNGNYLDLADAKSFSASGGRLALLEDEAFGAMIFLKVATFVGNNFTLKAYYLLC